MNHVRMSKPQRTLLEEVADAGVLYITRGKRYERTILALADRGLVYNAEPDYSLMRTDGWSITDLGRTHVTSQTPRRAGRDVVA